MHHIYADTELLSARLLIILSMARYHQMLYVVLTMPTLNKAYLFIIIYLFRISNHKLKIETGRYSKPITPLVYFRINGKHLLVQNTGAWGMDFVSSSPFSLLPPPPFFKIFI